MITAQNLSKSYRLWGTRSQFATLKSALLRRDLKFSPETSVPALKNVSFNVEKGEAFGIIGRNGSGKSTLLKLMSGILKPTSGRIIVTGRIAALIELGAGFHPEITGRENIYINGIMLGLTRRDIESRFDRIVEFSGIGEFLDQPVKTYSSGMYVRLGFAVAVHVDPDVLLIDEVLSVGDEEFSAKCIAKIQEMKYRGVTLIFVTHQLDQVRNLCDRALWLERGEAAMIGDPVRVVDQYLQEVAGTKLPAASTPALPKSAAEDPSTSLGAGSGAPKESASAGASDEASESDELLEEERWGSGEILLKHVALVDGQGNELVAVGAGTPVSVVMDVEVRVPQEDVVFGIGIYHADGTCVYGTNTDREGLVVERAESTGRVHFEMPSLDLVAGSYRVDAAVHTRNGRSFDYRRGGVRFVVGSRVHDVGIYRPKHDWRFDGGIAFRRIDMLKRNVPEPIAEYIRSNEEPEPEPESDPPKYRKRRRTS